MIYVAVYMVVIRATDTPYSNREQIQARYRTSEYPSTWVVTPAHVGDDVGEYRR